MAVTIDEHIAGFDVSVHEATVVHLLEPLTNVIHDLPYLVLVQSHSRVDEFAEV